jgi:nicotinamidase-related amidase
MPPSVVVVALKRGYGVGSGRESTFYQNSGYSPALVTEGILPLLREKLGVGHLIISGITTSGPMLATAVNATDLNFVLLSWRK